MPTIVQGDFEWDSDKAASNAAKHGVTFEEALLAMWDGLDDALEPAHLITLARSWSGRILYIVTTHSGERIRIISAREATRRERRICEETE